MSELKKYNFSGEPKNIFSKVKANVHFRMNLCYFKISYLRGPNHKTLEKILLE